MESRKAKRSPKWTAAPIDAILTAIEAHRKHIPVLGSFSFEVTMASKQQAYKIVTAKVRIYLYACMGIFYYFIVSLRHSRNMFLCFAGKLHKYFWR